MLEDRMTEPNPPLYREYMRLLEQYAGVLGMNPEEALAYWVTVLQRLAAEVEYGTNADPVAEAPRLFVLGKKGKENEYSEVDFYKDDPSKILDETWSPVEMREFDSERHEH